MWHRLVVTYGEGKRGVVGIGQEQTSKTLAMLNFSPWSWLCCQIVLLVHLFWTVLFMCDLNKKKKLEGKNINKYKANEGWVWLAHAWNSSA